MRTIILRLSAALFVLCCFNNVTWSQASCATAATLTPAGTCSVTTGNMQNAANALPAGACGGATATTTYSTWYKFTVTASSTTVAILVNGLGNNLSATTTYLEVLSGTCGSFTSIGCQNVSTRMLLSGLTVGVTYYARVYTTTNPTGNPANKWAFDICIRSAPANDDCSGAVSLTPNASCSSTAGTLDLATSTAGIPAGCQPAGTHYDVWYKFTATSSTHAITISGLGANLTSSAVQLFSGTCAGLTSLGCGTTSLVGSSLVIGNTYFVRVSNVGTNPSSATAADFDICVTTPTPAKVDYSKSYINVSKGNTGGTVNPGDTLEMRFTLVISARTVDSLSITDTLFNTKGFRLVPGSLALRTNEGKVYKTYSDGFDTDGGWYTNNGLDTVIRINFGSNASNVARGQLSNTSRPSVFGSTCIVMATYRVVVYAPYNSLINFKTGSLTYRDQSTTILNNITFNSNYLVVYQSPGLCPNAVSATNALGAEFNGTFGTPSGSTLPRNRGTSPYTSYTYGTFNASANSPQDYYYGITNNSSGKFTTANNWAKPDANSYRIFNLWDISGDHTGTNNAQGNVPCDTTKPVSASNPCGYMLVINSAYRADTAFTYTVNNLCPNTYYELSAWFKNMCYKCGCDSTGASATTAGYIPSALNDSSGVQPNIAFDVNGVDYFTTGNISYKGTTPTGSDATNQWMKRGFVYLTGPSETSFTLTLRNNAPGGGGNDWALDDISVTTCLPNMQYSPSLSPTTCNYNPVTINDTIRSYFNNYSNFKWQRSTNGGSTWTDVTTSGSSTPTWNGSAWEYITSYTIPPANTAVSNNGDRYRVVVATTSGNLANTNCQVTDGISIINLNVIDCNNPPPLATKLMSFTGKELDRFANLYWTTSEETEHTEYEIERSYDGTSFTTIGRVSGRISADQTNNYHFLDSAVLKGRTFYRIRMIETANPQKYSRIIQLGAGQNEFSLTRITVPFSNRISFDLSSSREGNAQVQLLNANGQVINSQTLFVHSGLDRYDVRNLDTIAPGIYYLRIEMNGQILNKKVLKN